MPGFDGDTPDHHRLPDWYEPHVEAWAKGSTAQTTLWFWNSEIGWASVHPVLERHGWRYVNANICNKGKGHIAGNVHTAKIQRFAVVTEAAYAAEIDPTYFHYGVERLKAETARDAERLPGV